MSEICHLISVAQTVLFDSSPYLYRQKREHRTKRRDVLFLVEAGGIATARMSRLHARGLRNRSPKGCDLLRKPSFSIPPYLYRQKREHRTKRRDVLFLVDAGGIATARMSRLHAHGLRNRSPKGCDLLRKPSFSIPHYLICRKIESRTKVRLSIFGGSGGNRYAATVAATRPRTSQPFTERLRFAAQTVLFDSPLT